MMFYLSEKLPVVLTWKDEYEKISGCSVQIKRTENSLLCKRISEFLTYKQYLYVGQFLRESGRTNRFKGYLLMLFLYAVTYHFRFRIHLYSEPNILVTYQNVAARDYSQQVFKTNST